MSAPPRVAVVGGGIAGLSAAWDVARAGVDVLVLEAGPTTGGPVVTGTVGGVVCDLGAESFLARRPEVIDLLATIGAGAQTARPRAAVPTVLRAGTRHALPGRTVLGVPSDPRTLAGLLTPEEVARAGTERVVPFTGDVSVADFVGSRLGPAVVDHVVDPLLAGVHAGRAERLSAAATLPDVVTRVAAGASLLAAVGSVVGAGGSDGDGPPFLGLTGGVGRLPRLLESAVVAAGGRVQRETTVVALTRSGPRWVITTRTPDGRPGPDRIGPVDAVVVATPAEVAGRLLAPLAPAAGSVLCAVRSADVGVVALAVDADSVPRLVHGTESGVLVPHAEARAAGLAVKALTFASAKWPWIVDQDPATAVLRASVGRADEPGALRLPDDALVARVVADTARIVGGPVRVRAAVVRRWPRSLPQYAVGHAEAMLQVRAAVSEVPGLGLAGAVLEGVGLPACVATGRAAAASALAHLSGTARPAVVPSAPAAPTVQEDS